LICKQKFARRAGVQDFQDPLVFVLARLENLQATVEFAETVGEGNGHPFLDGIWVGLVCVRTCFRNPVGSIDAPRVGLPRGRVMRQPSGVTNTCMTRGKAVVGNGNIHKLIHIFQYQHVPVQHSDSLELVQTINTDFRPSLIEARFRHRVGRGRIKPRDQKSRDGSLSKDLQSALTQRLRFRIWPKLPESVRPCR
jgi:hypothetical protein